jgi:hypothetical protein
MVMNKKGQELTLGTIILIVLGVVVLVFLIYGFSTGWTNLWDKLGISKSNVDEVVRDCGSYCTLEKQHSFCTEKRTIKYGSPVTVDGKEIKSSEGSCKQIVDNPNNYPGVNVKPCPGLC